MHLGFTVARKLVWAHLFLSAPQLRFSSVACLARPRFSVSPAGVGRAG